MSWDRYADAERRAKEWDTKLKRSMTGSIKRASCVSLTECLKRNNYGRVLQEIVLRKAEFSPRVPDAVLESTGGEFNFGPLSAPTSTLSKKLGKVKNALSQSTSAIRNNFSGKKHSGGRISPNGQPHLPTANNRLPNSSGRNANSQAPLNVVPPGKHLAPRTGNNGFSIDDDGTHEGIHSGFRQFRDDPTTPVPVRGGFAGGPILKQHSNSFCRRTPPMYIPRRNYPLRACFYNPSGYACCNRTLNDEIVRTFETLVAEPGFNLCNTQKIANALQTNCARRFKVNFEAIVGLADYAQRVNFGQDLLSGNECSRFMLVYATPTPPERVKRGDGAIVVDENTLKPIDRFSSTTARAHT
ncbi:ground-like domain protein [Cooperia oncophora]